MVQTVWCKMDCAGERTSSSVLSSQQRCTHTCRSATPALQWHCKNCLLNTLMYKGRHSLTALHHPGRWRQLQHSNCTSLRPLRQGQQPPALGAAAVVGEATGGWRLGTVMVTCNTKQQCNTAASAIRGSAAASQHGPDRGGCQLCAEAYRAPEEMRATLFVVKPNQTTRLAKPALKPQPHNQLICVTPCQSTQ
jgi:hypothetical protein